MAQTKLGELVVNTSGNLPAIGSVAPDFQLTGNDLKDVSLKAFAGKNVVLNIFQASTPVCVQLRFVNSTNGPAHSPIPLCFASPRTFRLP